MFVLFAEDAVLGILFFLDKREADFSPVRKKVFPNWEIFLPQLEPVVNFAQPYFEDCFRGYFSAVVRSVAGYVTKYSRERDRKDTQKRLNKSLKKENLRQALGVVLGGK